MHSQIAEGQEAVFRYGRRLKTWADNSSFWHPRLWCFLVGPVILTTVLLALTVNLFWKHSFDEGLARQEEADTTIFENFNNSTTDILTHFAHQLQASTALSAMESVSRYTGKPALVADINSDYVQSLSPFLSKSEELNWILHRCWMELTQLFPEVDYIYYGDRFGTFLGYERLPLSFLNETHGDPTVFGGEFRAPDGTAGMQMCDLCPPADAVKEGEKTYYFVNHKGQFIKAYKTHGYDPRKRPWYEAAKEAKGELVWLDIYSHSSGHTLGMTAAKAITSNNEVVAVVAADFTISYFSGFLKLVTRMISQEEGFIIDFKTGLMVASSSGIGQVAKKIVDQGLEAQVRFSWKQVDASEVQAPLRTLLGIYGSLDRLPRNGTINTTDGKFLFTFTQGLPGSFQAKQHWLVVVTCPVKAFMEKSWEQQAWAEQRSAQVRQELRTDLAAQEVNTIWTCVTFTFLGALIMICIGLAVTRPLKRISTEMLSMAKLEFLPQDPLKAEIGAGKSLRRRSSTSFVSLRYVGRLMSTLTGSVKREDTEPGSSSSSSSGSDTDSQDEADCSLYVEEGGGCWTHATPKEVINIREAFIYMVAGLKSFARYMDPEIMRILVKSRRQAQLGMGKAEVTVFFSDIANFTTIAESLEPETFMSMLTEYLDEMSKIIMAKRGVVGEFIGDAIMAWWNVPINLGQEHTATALDAALAQQNRLAELRETWHLQRLPDVRVRMGLVKGNVLAGNIGSSQRMKYGLVGDSVNLASRLEGLCKYYGVSIIIEQDAAFAPGVQSRFQLRLLDLVIVKGRTQPTELYQLVCEKAVLPEAFDSPEDLQFFIDAYSQIHRLYRLKSFDACASALHHYRQRLPDDVPSKMLLRRVETLLGEGVPADWTPVHILTEK